MLQRSQEPIPQQFWNITHAHPGHSLALRRFTPHTLTHTHTFEFGVVAWRMGGIRPGGNHRQGWFGPGRVQLGRDSLWWGKAWGRPRRQTPPPTQLRRTVVDSQIHPPTRPTGTDHSDLPKTGGLTSRLTGYQVWRPTPTKNPHKIREKSKLVYPDASPATLSWTQGLTRI